MDQNAPNEKKNTLRCTSVVKRGACGESFFRFPFTYDLAHFNSTAH